MRDYLSGFVDFMPLPEPEKLVLALDTIRKIKRRVDEVTGIADAAIGEAARSFYGMPVISNPALPVDRPCKECGGSGTVATRTYCLACDGLGGDRVIALVTGQRPTFITEPLHDRILPSFPLGLVAPPPLSRGLV